MTLADYTMTGVSQAAGWTAAVLYPVRGVTFTHPQFQMVERDAISRRITGQTHGSVMNAMIFRMCGVLPPCLYAYLYIGIATGTGAVLHSTLSVPL